jgi:penicillin-binding protein 1A
MGEERPGFKPGQDKNAEGSDAAPPRSWTHRFLAGLSAEWRHIRGDFSRFVNRIEWGNKWPAYLRWPAMFLAALGLTAAAGVAAIFVLFLMVGPNISLDGDLYAMNRPPALTFVDKSGKNVGVRGSIVGERLKLADMPPYLPAAFIAMEDKRFYQHHGIDPQGLARAAVVDFKAGHVVQGGSTITQQVVKIVFLSPDRTFSRKFQEIAGAWELERKLGKAQILELYLNRIYLGSGAYGVDGAAKVYFGKSARELTVAEAAMLAALTRAPSAFSPRRDLAAAQERAKKVLAEMQASRVLTSVQVAEAEAHPATVVDHSEDLARDYFLDAAAEEVQKLIPSATGDLTVSTTMDTDLQSAAQQQMDKVMSRGKAMKASQAAIVSMTTDGAVRALIGGRDYAESAFNRVTKAHRQPGSAFKTFVYLAALEHGLTPATVRTDEPITIKDWTPDNYNETHLGPVTLEQAYARSINTVAVQLGLEVGIPSVISVARRLGIESPLSPYASLALGTSDVTPLELTAAYATFPAGGYRVQPYMVVEVRKSDGTVVYRRNQGMRSRVVSDNDLLSMNELMYQVVQWGTGTGAAVPGHEVGGKTGTSADYRDAWFVGFSPELVTGVWVGNDDYTPMKKVTGGSLPAQIWSGYMRVALKNTPPTPLPRAQPAPAVAQADPSTSTDMGENAVQRGLDQLGSFLGDLFGASSSSAKASKNSADATPPNTTFAATPPPSERTAAAENRAGFFPDAANQTYVAGGSGSTSSNSVTGSSSNLITGASGSTTSERSGNATVDPPPQPRRDTGEIRNLEDQRRAMMEDQRRATIEEQRRVAQDARDRYNRDLERYNRDIDRYRDRYGRPPDRDMDMPPPPRDAYDRGDDRTYRMAEPRPMPRGYEPPPFQRYEMAPPFMPRYAPPPPMPRDYNPPPRNYGPPMTDDDRGPPPDMVPGGAYRDYPPQ